MTHSVSAPSFPMTGILGLGALRSAAVNVLAYPFEVVKTRQQALTASASSYNIASTIWRTEGFSGFYSGFLPHFVKGILRQSVWWPAIAYLPPVLQKYQFSTLAQHVTTGWAIATADALVNTPLDKWKVLASTGNRAALTSNSLIREGWKGFSSYWKRQGITWSLFLIGQHHFNKPFKEDSHAAPLTPWQVFLTSAKLSLIANVIINPFDLLNTKKQSGSNSRVRLTNVMSLYRGLPLNFLIVLIQISPTVFLMDRIQPQAKV